jgi:hypothetical protein
VRRQVFEAFDLEVLYGKAGREIEISATVSEAVANAFEKQKALPKEGSLVVVREVAGARSVSLPPHAYPRDQSAPQVGSPLQLHAKHNREWAR